MWVYVIRRILQVIPVLFLISLATFALLNAMPGDPLAELMMADPDMSEEDLANLRRIYGLDQPFQMRYLRWMEGVIIERDLGSSQQYKVPVTTLIARNVENTFYLVFSSFILSLFVAIPIGIYSALRQYSLADYFWTGFSFFGFSVPNHWLGLLLLFLFSVQLEWTPVGGFQSIRVPPDFFSQLLDRLHHLILPMITLGMSSLAGWMRYMRSTMLEVIREDYIRTARAKGIAERKIIYKHALRNAILPVITLVMMAIPMMLGGAVITEAVFVYPGMGRLFWHSLINQDNFVSMAIIMIIAVLVVLFNLLADILYAWIDPRIRYD